MPSRVRTSRTGFASAGQLTPKLACRISRWLPRNRQVARIPRCRIKEAILNRPRARWIRVSGTIQLAVSPTTRRNAIRRSPARRTAWIISQMESSASRSSPSTSSARAKRKRGLVEMDSQVGMGSKASVLEFDCAQYQIVYTHNLYRQLIVVHKFAQLLFTVRAGCGNDLRTGSPDLLGLCSPGDLHTKFMCLVQRDQPAAAPTAVIAAAVRLHFDKFFHKAV